ncbi:MAG: alkane 1-monooxygenase [Pseudomonadota bacterium]|nr:alkane 1-monooxygenase [Pseudomonadota bacterium]
MIPYLFFPLIILLSASIGIIISPNWAFAPFILILVIIPLIDFFAPKIDRPDEKLNNHLAYSLILILVFPSLALLFFAGIWIVPAMDSYISAGFLGASVGMATGSVGLPAAHELIHRKDSSSQKLGVAILIFCFYGHFKIEHIHGHHSKVATKADPATARLGENVYIYLFRCIVMSWLSAWETQKILLKRSGRRFISHKNRLLIYLVIKSFFFLGVYIFFGFNGLIFLAAHTFIAVVLLEVVEYIQHYGMKRVATNTGYLEPYNEKHAWNCRHCATNWSTFNLGLHSEHHSQPGKPFPLLSNKERLMEMPAGYPIMIILALIPPIWFRVFNPKLRNIGQT